MKKLILRNFQSPGDIVMLLMSRQDRRQNGEDAFEDGERLSLSPAEGEDRRSAACSFSGRERPPQDRQPGNRNRQRGDYFASATR